MYKSLLPPPETIGVMVDKAMRAMEERGPAYLAERGSLAVRRELAEAVAAKLRSIEMAERLG